MSTNYPAALDALNNPSASDSLAGHAAQHANLNDAVEALQTKVGVDGSTDPASIEYKLATHTHSAFLTEAEADAAYDALGAADAAQAAAALDATSKANAAAAASTPIAHATATDNPHAVTKTQVGLGNVDNTSDANKPISTLQAAALGAKQDTLISGTNIMTLNGVSILNAGDLQVGGGIGASTTLFLNQTAAFEDNYSLTDTPTGLPESLTSVVCNAGTNAGVTFIERYVSPPLEGTSIEGGIWRFNTYGSVSSNTGLNEIITRANRRREVTGVIVTMTGSGPTRTLTATTGTPFLPEHATASPLTAALLEIPGQTMWISGYTSATQVTVTLTDSAFVNATSAALNAIYTLLFSVSTGDLTGSTANLYKTETTQPPFSIIPTDRLVLAYFGKTDSGSNRTISLYRDGSTHYSNTETPIAQRHNQLGGLNEGQYLHATPAEKATWNAKQSALVSGTNIKTINGTSLLGSGDIAVAASGGAGGYEQTFLMMGA